MAAAVAGEVLGPRPGRAICSFWQGNVEMLLRDVAVLVGSLPALVAAAVAVGTLANLDSSVTQELNNATETADLERNTYGSGGWVIGIAGLAIIIEVLFIVLRICNIGLINLKIKVFLIIDMVLSVIFGLGHLAGGIVCAIYAADWNDVSVTGSNSDRMRDSLAASAAFCFLSLLLYLVLAVWSVLFMMKEWNDKVVKYTLKEAITG